MSVEGGGLMDRSIAGAATLVFCGTLSVNLSTSQIALLGCAVALGVAAFRRPGELWRAGVAPGEPVLLAAAVLYAAVLISRLVSPVGATSYDFVERCRTWLALLPLAVALAWGGPRLRSAALWCLLAGAAAVSVLGIVQHFTGASPGAELLGIRPSRWQIPAPGDPARFAAVGLFYNRTRFGHVLLVALAFALGGLLWGRSGKARVAAGVLGLPIFTAFLLTYTRAALIALGLALWGFVVIDRRSPRLVKVAGAVIVLLVLAATAAVPALRDRALSSLNLFANQDRLFIWQRAWEIAADFGATGIGFGNYGLAHNLYYDQADALFPTRTQAHNLYLSFLVEMGPLGLTALLVFLGVCVRRAFQAPDGHGQDRALRAGAGIAVLAMAVLSLFHDPVYQAVEALAFFLGPAVLASLGERGVEGEAPG